MDSKALIKYHEDYYKRVALDVRKEDLQTLEDAAARAGYVFLTSAGSVLIIHIAVPL